MRETLCSNDAAPQRLFYPTDAVGLAAAVRRQSVRALDWRLGWGDAFTHYGIGRVDEFLAQRAGTTQDAFRKTFCEASRLNFNPRGTHFDAFVARFFECALLGHPAAPSEYALGLSVSRLSATTCSASPKATARLAAAIYDREHQRSIIDSVYSAYEDYFVSAIQRFGERYLNDLQTPCWDKFRHDIGSMLIRFRDPFLANECEWIAIALIGPQTSDIDIKFEIIGNRFVPTVALDLRSEIDCERGACAIDTIVTGPSLPYEPTREVLQAFLARTATGKIRIQSQSPAD